MESPPHCGWFFQGCTCASRESTRAIPSRGASAITGFMELEMTVHRGKCLDARWREEKGRRTAGELAVERGRERCGPGDDSRFVRRRCSLRAYLTDAPRTVAPQPFEHAHRCLPCCTLASTCALFEHRGGNLRPALEAGGRSTGAEGRRSGTVAAQVAADLPGPSPPPPTCSRRCAAPPGSSDFCSRIRNDATCMKRVEPFLLCLDPPPGPP